MGILKMPPFCRVRLLTRDEHAHSFCRCVPGFIVLKVLGLKKKNKKKNNRGCAVARAVAYHPRCPASIPGVNTICGLSLLLVLVPSRRFFSGFSGFPSSTKTNISKFHFDPERTDTFERAPRALWCYVGKQITFTFFQFVCLVSKTYI